MRWLAQLNYCFNVNGNVDDLAMLSFQYATSIVMKNAYERWRHIAQVSHCSSLKLVTLYIFLNLRSSYDMLIKPNWH